MKRKVIVTIVAVVALIAILTCVLAACDPTAKFKTSDDVVKFLKKNKTLYFSYVDFTPPYVINYEKDKGTVDLHLKWSVVGMKDVAHYIVFWKFFNADDANEIAEVLRPWIGAQGGYQYGNGMNTIPIYIDKILIKNDLVIFGPSVCFSDLGL